MQEDLAVNICSMRYPNSKDPGNLIEGLHFTVPFGEFVSFLGPSGAGKTTLLRMIAGLERRFDGGIELGGKTISTPSRDIQTVFQDNRLLPWKTVEKNIEFAIRHQDSQSKKAIVEKWLKIVRLTNRKDAWPKTLSGGEESRVAFARTFVDPPKVLLLDEPFHNLDLVVRFELQEELLKILQIQPTTVVMVSHSVEDAVFLSDTVYLVSDSPMKIEATFPIEVKKPREPKDPKLSEISDEITRHMRKFERDRLLK